MLSYFNKLNITLILIGELAQGHSFRTSGTIDRDMGNTFLNKTLSYVLLSLLFSCSTQQGQAYTLNQK